jgi:nucleoid DNA-binding protein
MINHDLIKELASLQNVDQIEAKRLLNGFFSAMVTELLSARNLSVKGLGSFRVMHLPLKKISNPSGITYIPPCNKLMFDRHISGADYTPRLVALMRLMNSAESERFSRSLAVVFSHAVTQKREIRINGLGRFEAEQGNYSFMPERSLEELLNREYQNLEEVVLSRNIPAQVGKGGQRRRYAVPLISLFIGVLLLALLYYLYHETIFSVSTARHPQIKVAIAVPQGTILNRAHAILTVTSNELPIGTAADSVVIEKGDYTIILETFRMEGTAFKEQARLKSEGIIAYIWPAHLHGIKYYRLTTGKFSNREEAIKRMKGMPEKITGSAYIQQVLKKSVLHGK